MTKAFTPNRPGVDLPWGSLYIFNDITTQCAFVRAWLSQIFARGNITW